MGRLRLAGRGWSAGCRVRRPPEEGGVGAAAEAFCDGESSVGAACGVGPISPTCPIADIKALWKRPYGVAARSVIAQVLMEGRR